MGNGHIAETVLPERYSIRRLFISRVFVDPVLQKRFSWTAESVSLEEQMVLGKAVIACVSVICRGALAFCLKHLLGKVIPLPDQCPCTVGNERGTEFRIVGNLVLDVAYPVAEPRGDIVSDLGNFLPYLHLRFNGGAVIAEIFEVSFNVFRRGLHKVGSENDRRSAYLAEEATEKVVLAASPVVNIEEWVPSENEARVGLLLDILAEIAGIELRVSPDVHFVSGKAAFSVSEDAGRAARRQHCRRQDYGAYCS